MGLGGIGPGSLLLVFLIVVLLFGTKKLRGIGEDLGHAVKSFRKGLQEEKEDASFLEQHETDTQKKSNS